MGTFEGVKIRVARDFPCGGCRATVVYQAEAAAILDEYERGSHLTLEEFASACSLEVYHVGRTGPTRNRLQRIAGFQESSFDAAVPLGEVLGDRPLHTNQDHQRLTFADASFDLMVSSHVLEHVPDWRAALAESYRVLRPGGRYIFTIPGRTLLPASVARAEVVDGEVIHHLDPQFHNSPEGEPVLVFTDFGQDLVEVLEALGYVVSVRRPHRMIQRAGHSFVVVAAKPAAPA